ncbi:hypothetical protein UlMin_031764 [Ulmus minor]
MDGGFSNFLWNKFKEDSAFALYQPFFVCMAAGNLDSSDFHYCISQEVYFLQAFQEVYELIEKYVDEEIAKETIGHLKELVRKKILIKETHTGELKGATSEYITFLSKTASGQVKMGSPYKYTETDYDKTKLATYTFGAIAPCIRLYTHICNEIKPFMDPDSSNFYKQWFEMFSSQQHEEAVKLPEKLLDDLSVSSTSEELEMIEAVYYQAMKHMMEFFAAQPVSQQTVVPLCRVPNDHSERYLTIFCDFDSTFFSFDSFAILAEAIVRISPDSKEKWEALSSQYAEEFEQCVESITSGEAANNFDYEGIRDVLEQVGEFEKKQNVSLEELELLKGLSPEDINVVAHRFAFQEGCETFLQSVQNENPKPDVHVISYSWSGNIIRSVFASGGLDAMISNVHSNELAFEDDVTTGEIVKNVETPLEKLQVFIDILKDRKGEGNHLTVYIGAKVSDLLCLLEADIGIVIGSSPSLRKVGDQFGVSFEPLFSGVVGKQKEVTDEAFASIWKPLSGTLYTVSSWFEIRAFILGWKNHS